MKRSRLVVLGMVAAAITVAGCNSNKKDDDAMASNQKYKILSGSTAENRANAQRGGAEDGPEPALNVETRFAAGRLAETQGKFDCAVVQYDQALRLNPKHVPSLYRLGVVWTRTGEFDKAIPTWKRYVDATNNVASSYSNLGFCYEMAGDVANAEGAYKEGIQRDPQSMPCRTNYGLMLARQNRSVEAEVQLSAVLKPDEVSYNLAAVYQQQGALARAKDELKKAMEVNPNNTDVQTKLATLPPD